MNGTNTNLRDKIKILKKSVYDYLRRARASYRFQAELKTKLRKPKAILIDQMGKVGSSAIVASLEALKLDTPIYHTHYLNPDQIRYRLEKIKLEGRKLKVGSHLITSKYLSKIITKSLSDKQWKVITLVREPISRNISAFFQNINIFIPNFVERYQGGSLQTIDVIDTFLTSYSHDLPLKWFDEEINNVFNVEVFKNEFPKARGYKIFNNKNLSLLVIRLEDLNQCYNNAFNEFMMLVILN